tara:strand:- start:6729 stop:8393 length:1665 start_codon:yes stop_codon:yes gene_type:complete
MNNLKIYDVEIADGIADVIKSNASISYAAQAVPCSKDSIFSSSEKEYKTLASYKDEDLYYVQSILVTSNWNRNDDIFEGKEIWRAKNTPEDKPTNLEHDENTIIGHIISNWPITEEGMLIDKDTPEDNLPKKYHILTGSVIYRAFSDPKLKLRAEQLIHEIENGEKYVSMECMFSGFDYGLLNKQTNAYEILPRSETTAYLTKHLRAYGGTGEHEDYKIGRVLRQIVFSGKGFVAKPANPESVILTMKTESADNELKNINNFTELGVTTLKSSFNSEVEPMNLDKDVSEIKNQIESIAKSSESIQDSFSKTASDLEKQYSELSEALTASKSDSEAKADQISKLDEELKAKSEETETKNTELSTALETIASHEETIKAHEEKIASLTESIASSDSIIAEYKMKEEEMEKKEKLMKRKAQLLESGVDADSAEATLEKFESLDDETFDAMTEVLAGMKPVKKEEAMDPNKMKKMVNKDEEAESKSPRKMSPAIGEETEATSEEQEAEESEETSAEILDSVEVEEEVNLSVGEEAEDSVESTRAALVDFVNSRLSTKN